MKKRATIAAVIAMALSTTSYAHPHDPKSGEALQPVMSEASVAAEAATGPALWKVADEDTTIYLFGTVHVLPKDIDWYKGNIADALGASDKLITEIHTVPGKETEMQAIFMDKGSLPASQSLRGLLTDDQKLAYEAALTKLGLPSAALDRFEPWFASVNLGMIPLLKAGYSPDAGVESVLEAKSVGKQRGALETVEFQVGVFDGLPMESQVNFMMETANGIDEIVPGLDALVKAWANGNPEGLAKLMNEGFSDPVVAEALLYTRNGNWAEWIDTRLDKPGTIFIAVGAGHLAGDRSVQDLLATRGITSTRVQ